MVLTASSRLLLFLFMLYLAPVTAQQVQTVASPGYISSTYTSNLGLNARLYNGPEYVDFSHTVKLGFPYFDSKNFQPGSVVFDSILYPGLQVRLDLVNEYLMVLHPISFVSMQLKNETVGAFTIGSHQFYHLGTDSTAGIRNGFYESVYDGKTKVYVRHRKELQDRNKSDDIYREAVPSDAYFVFKENRYYPVKSSKTLLAVFRGKEKIIQQHLRKKKIRFKRDNQLAIVEAASFFDQLTN